MRGSRTREPPMSIASNNRRAEPLAEDILNILSNVLFPVVVFLIWAIATTIGTIVDQNQSPERYYQEYPVAVANVVLRLHLTNVFHSLPYIALVVLLLLSMSVCTFRRVIPKRFPKDRAVPIEHFALHASHRSNEDAPHTLATVERYFRDCGFGVRLARIESAGWVFGDKQKFARYGVLVAHLGFAVIVFGVFLGWLGGYRGQLQIFSGETARIAEANVALTLNKFTAAFEPVRTSDGVMYQASKFQSDVTVRGPGSVSAAKILVNHPYVLPQKVYVYQASYGFAGHLDVRRLGKRLSLSGTQGRLMPQDAVFLPDTSRAIEYGAMLGPSDPSQVPIGMPLPRVDEYALWIFHDDIPTTRKPILLPVGKSVNAGDGYIITALPPVPWSGLTYRRDPGELWVGAGAVILMAGFALALFFVPVKVYARVCDRNGATTVDIAATTTKGNAIYEEQFAGLMKGLGQALTARERPQRSAVEAYA